jgi:hypothetical protein
MERITYTYENFEEFTEKKEYFSGFKSNKGIQYAKYFIDTIYYYGKY